MKLLVLLLVAWCMCFAVSAQERTAGIEKNKKLPTFELNSLKHSSKSRFSNRDLSGKYTIIDFWTTGCPACISGFRKFDAIKKILGDSIQIILIGKDLLNKETVSGAISTFEKYRDKWKFDLPVAFDSNIFHQFQVPFIPYCIWIDVDGIVKEITTTSDVTESNVRKFISGKAISITQGVERVEQEPAVVFDYHKPLLLQGNGGFDSIFLFRSVLARWNKESLPYVQPFITSVNRHSKGRYYWAGVEKNRVQANGASLLQLYDLAYGDTVNHTPGWFEGVDREAVDFYSRSSYGRIWSEPVLEVKDTMPFAIDWVTGINSYSYSLIVPEVKASAAFMQRMMQADLEKYFSYDASVELRKMPCWRLTAAEDSRHLLETKGERVRKVRQPAAIELSNVPLYELIRNIYEYNATQPPIIDETGIDYKIDVNLAVLLMDFDEVRIALRKKGLILEKSTKMMEVIVIRDRPQ